MMNHQNIEKIANERGNPCITVSMNTHRTHPDNVQDAVLLKNLLHEAEERLLREYDKRLVEGLLANLHSVSVKIDINYSLESLHVFLSNTTCEIFQSSWKTNYEGVKIADRFSVESLIKEIVRSNHYVIMLLSQSGVHLYEVVNDSIISEINNGDFPISDNQHYSTHSDKRSDPAHLDDLVREFLNKVDKALLNYLNNIRMECLVICTEDNYSRLMQVSDKPEVYIGYSPINYNNISQHQLGKQAWKLIQEVQNEENKKVIENMRENVSTGLVVTDLQDIYQASVDGNGELLIVHNDFSQAVKMLSERTFEYISDSKQMSVIDDITGIIAWEVFSRKGNVIFTHLNEIKEIGEIVLKKRY